MVLGWCPFGESYRHPSYEHVENEEYVNIVTNSDTSFQNSSDNNNSSDNSKFRAISSSSSSNNSTLREHNPMNITAPVFTIDDSPPLRTAEHTSLNSTNSTTYQSACVPLPVAYPTTHSSNQTVELTNHEQKHKNISSSSSSTGHKKDKSNKHPITAEDLTYAMRTDNQVDMDEFYAQEEGSQSNKKKEKKKEQDKGRNEKNQKNKDKSYKPKGKGNFCSHEIVMYSHLLDIMHSFVFCLSFLIYFSYFFSFTWLLYVFVFIFSPM